MTQLLVLDKAVRDWVFIPLTACIIFMKLIQQFAHMVRASGSPRFQCHGCFVKTLNNCVCDLAQLMSAPTVSNKEPKEIREMQLVTRSQRLRAASRFIPESGFKMRKEFFVGKVSVPG